MAKTTKKSITKESNIAEIVSKYPEVGLVLAEDYGLHCVGCMAMRFDSLEAGMKIHGYDDKDIEKIVKKLNKL